MIYELKKDQFYRCADLANRSASIESRAIVAGINPGRIFVDNPDVPQTAMIWQGNLDGFMFVGNSNNAAFNEDINPYIDQVIVPQAKELGMNWFECIGDHSSWYSIFENEIFPDRDLSTWNQFVYTLSPQDYQSVSRSDNDQEYTIERITRELLHSKTILNLELVESKISEFWDEPSDFFDNGIGFCVMHYNLIVSICMTGFRYRGFHGIDIETIETYRGKKLAQNAVVAFVEYCFMNGFTPYWDCSESNGASNAVAKSLGFQKEFSYKGYEFKI